MAHVPYLFFLLAENRNFENKIKYKIARIVRCSPCQTGSTFVELLWYIHTYLGEREPNMRSIDTLDRLNDGTNGGEEH